MSTYSYLKETAKQNGIPVTDLLALAPQNDPFYAGTPGDIQKARWFLDVWRSAGYSHGVHLRRIHYWAVSQSPALLMPDGTPYENTDRCWKFLGQASKIARYLNYVDIKDVVDRKNPAPTVNTYYAYEYDPVAYAEVPELQDPYITVANLTNSDAQPYHLEIWCEKSTMNDVLEPLCARYGANLVTFEGEVSISAVYQLVQRIEEANGKPTRIFYISDFDPAGNSMPVAMSRKIEFMLDIYQHKEWDVKVQSIVLTPEQVIGYGLPRTPIKASEKRGEKFEERFGAGATELDALEALHEGELAKIVGHFLQTYFNNDALAEVRRTRSEIQEEMEKKVQALTQKYSEEIEALRKYQDELEDLRQSYVSRRVETYAPHVEEVEEDFLFSSARTYGQQLNAYRCHKRA